MNVAMLRAARYSGARSGQWISAHRTKITGAAYHCQTWLEPD
ncbi:hypothetical protein ACLK1T_18195 [Escherichia coli]